MNTTSLYEPHFEGPTPRFAVAYLLQLSSSNSDREDTAAEVYPSFETQREAIALAAMKDGAVVIAEYSDFEPQGDPTTWPGLQELDKFNRTHRPWFEYRVIFDYVKHVPRVVRLNMWNDGLHEQEEPSEE